MASLDDDLLLTDKEKSRVIDWVIIVREAFQSCYGKTVELMQPEAILELFYERNVFSNATRTIVRDMQECLRTSDTNRAIHARVMEKPCIYTTLKGGLSRSGQTGLLDILERAEVRVHDAKIEKGHRCSCMDSESCEILTSIKCSVNLRPFITHTVKDIQDSLIQFYKEKCLDVPVYPLIPDVTEHVTNLYVTPNMLEEDIRGRELGLDSQSCRKTSTAKLTITGYRDIFYKDGKPCRNIYITGEAGIGKSALCESMVSTWCHAHLKSDEVILSEDEKVMAEFPLLFLISLRYAIDQHDIEQMIYSQLPVKDLNHVLENEKCLVILDGLDEWVSHETLKGSKYISKGLPHRNLEGRFVVMTTIRPWKLELLRLKEKEIDKQIKITGLNVSSAELLAKRVLTVLNATHGSSKEGSEFLRFMTSSRLDEYLKTPVLLSQMICLWYYEVPFGDSECEIYCNIIDKQIELADQQKELPRNMPKNIDNPQRCPELLKTKENCLKFSRTLMELSKVAFKTFFHENREYSLVFNHTENGLYGMLPTDVEVCLRIGLLTQSKVFINFIEKSKKISFIHKTHHEFFAALYIATLDTEDIQRLILSNKMINLDVFIEIHKVLLFVNGMNDDAGNTLLKHMLSLAVDDDRVNEYRRSCIGPCDKNYPLVNRVQSIVCVCETERQRNRFPASRLHIDDLVAFNRRDFYMLMEHWNVLKPERVRSVSLQTGSSDQNMTEMINMVFQCTLESDRLEKIYIWDDARFFSETQLYTAVVGARSTLTCLVLCHVDVTKLGVKLQDILTLRSLRTLGLGDMFYLTHEQLELVSTFLGSEYDGIEELRLKSFLCTTHSKTPDECRIAFEMPRNKTLKKLYVAGRVDKISIDTRNLDLLEARSLTVPGIIKDLLGCLWESAKLSELDLSCDFPADKLAIVETLPHLSCIKQVRLSGMDFRGIPLRFPQSMRTLEFVQLRDLVIENNCLRDMVENLPKQRVEIWMGKLKIDHDEDKEFVKHFIRTSPNFEVTLDDPDWMYFHTV